MTGSPDYDTAVSTQLARRVKTRLLPAAAACGPWRRCRPWCPGRGPVSRQDGGRKRGQDTVQHPDFAFGRLGAGQPPPDDFHHVIPHVRVGKETGNQQFLLDMLEEDFHLLLRRHPANGGSTISTGSSMPACSTVGDKQNGLGQVQGRHARVQGTVITTFDSAMSCSEARCVQPRTVSQPRPRPSSTPVFPKPPCARSSRE